MLTRVGTLLAILTVASADTIANCTYNDALGTWTFYESPRTGNSALQCDTWTPDENSKPVTFHLREPNVAVDGESNNTGVWTLIYNQGFEIIINMRQYFVFFRYNSTSYDCSKTMPSWSHDVLNRNWACITAVKSESSGAVTVKRGSPTSHPKRPFKNNHDFIRRINEHQKSWQAAAYPHFEKFTHDELQSMWGSKVVLNRPAAREDTEEVKRVIRSLPKHFDWRNVSGVNYVSPVRAQGTCGSCYAFASMAMLEARIRVATGNRKQPVFSTQNIVSCSKYSQGCAGGFPYLVAGKYAQDFGVVAEECNPYVGKETPTCDTLKNCSRTYTASYRYIGGYYGACSEGLMMSALVRNGPIAVSFEVYPDLKQYQGGIYHHTGLTEHTEPSFNPFEITNHVVVIVGYGEDETTGEKYWIVKNSWGTQWGENGFFRIRRGTDECGIESIAVEAFPIP